MSYVILGYRQVIHLCEDTIHWANAEKKKIKQDAFDKRKSKLIAERELADSRWYNKLFKIKSNPATFPSDEEIHKYCETLLTAMRVSKYDGYIAVARRLKLAAIATEDKVHVSTVDLEILSRAPRSE